MNDNDIILGLKCLADEDEILCKDCAFLDRDRGFACKKNVSKAAIDFINRQKAEIERLIDLINEVGEYNEAWVKDNHDLRVELKAAKSDTIREFAERFKERCGKNCDSAIIWAKGTIDNLVKEMTEEYHE